VIHVAFTETFEGLRIEMIPKGSGSENNSWLKMAIPAEGVDAIRTFVIDCVLGAGGRTCPPTIVGVGIGGTADLCVHLAKVAATRPLGTHCADPTAAALEQELSEAVNMLGIGPQGLGGDATAFAVHVEACGDAHHDEPGGRQHAMPLGATRERGPDRDEVEYGY
jgi:fumarate hydratase subunit alpha/L(+)-tartrate dehydratase alpha subunit